MPHVVSLLLLLGASILLKLATCSRISKSLLTAPSSEPFDHAQIERERNKYANDLGNSLWTESAHLDGWYTKLDLCILRSTSNDSVQSIMSKCEAEVLMQTKEEVGGSGGAALLSRQPVRCRVGNSWPSKGEYCSPEDIPFSERKILRRAIVGFDDPSAKPLAKLFAGLAREKGALLLVGDSVMQQFFGAMACELEREGVWKDPSQFTNTDEVKYVESTLAVGAETQKVSVPIKFAPIYHFVNGRWDRVANASMHHLRKNVEDFLHAHDSVTVLINMGLHYVSNPIAHFTRQDYISQMTSCLQYLNALAIDSKKAQNKTLRVLWRETSAQHFPTSNGYWPGVKYAASMQLKCEPIADTSSSGDWRNSDIRAIIAEHNLQHVQILPFYNVTLPLWSMHVNGHLRDCTHFCWSPMLYQSLFHALAGAVNL
jgi:hypothetical protein